MKQIDTIRAALERGLEVLPTYAKTYAQLAEALTALAELEKAAATPRLWLAEPVAGDYAGYENDIVSAAAPEWAIKRAQRCYYAEFRAVPLYAAPPAPVAEMREPTPEECGRIENQFTVLNMRLETSEGRDMFDAVASVMWPKEGL